MWAQRFLFERMVEVRKIILIQHCQSEHHINNMSGGWTDTPLTDLGRKQADLVGLSLINTLDHDAYTLYSSDLLRAKQTAEIVGSHLNLQVIEDSNLREINTGIAAGKTKDWIRDNRNPRIGSDFDMDYQEFQEGETWREFYSRICCCMERICNTEEKDLIIVTHGGTLAYIIAWWMNFQPQMLSKAYFSASVGSISILNQNSYKQNVLSVLNDTAHLSLLI
ncbi:histidine phosphatase family protein [Paenibacillus sp. 19GGS1-52]|uniref:histidine phosphatase family protein n=1 Tax=Paenibacillus sp. 19GGS1-52 TaxID=2758563 RepID=UPI001EFA65CC|nr:histidine phosphatase family protein [Paenibacillus sp. 19GGS1-52]ULO09905.1 histidine phosphatase family protein [Paenibacillus sp. 19GGS1-52]